MRKWKLLYVVSSLVLFLGAKGPAIVLQDRTNPFSLLYLASLITGSGSKFFSTSTVGNTQFSITMNVPMTESETWGAQSAPSNHVYYSTTGWEMYLVSPSNVTFGVAWLNSTSLEFNLTLAYSTLPNNEFVFQAWNSTDAGYPSILILVPVQPISVTNTRSHSYSNGILTIMGEQSNQTITVNFATIPEFSGVASVVVSTLATSVYLLKRSRMKRKAS